MNATPERAVPSASDPTAMPGGDLVTPLLANAVDVVSAWCDLLSRELALAHRSVRWLLVGAVVVPVVGLSAWLSLSVLLVALVHEYTSSWLLALLLGTGVQMLALAILVNRLQHWARDLSLPQSRAALVRAMERMS